MEVGKVLDDRDLAVSFCIVFQWIFVVGCI